VHCFFPTAPYKYFYLSAECIVCQPKIGCRSICISDGTNGCSCGYPFMQW
jgi:hypothetical protein